jgi:hypothetical protein
MTASGRTQPHMRTKLKIAKLRRFCRSQGLICGFGEWGGWDSNPGPADYSSGDLSALPSKCLVNEMSWPCVRHFTEDGYATDCEGGGPAAARS